MRHIASLFAGLFIAPIAWLLIGAGVTGLDPNGLYQHAAGRPSTAIALAMLACAGILLGLIAVTRISPIGPLVAAAVFGGAFLLYRFTSFHFSLPSSFEAAKMPANASAVAGESGAVLVIAILLAMTALVPSRWRGKNTDEDRVVDTASLASSTAPPLSSPPVQPGDSFPSSQTPSTSETRMLSNTTLQQSSPAPAAEERPRNPFETAPQDQRSPYADESYDSEQYSGYREQPRYGAEQGYGDRSHYGSEQGGYGDRSGYYR